MCYKQRRGVLRVGGAQQAAPGGRTDEGKERGPNLEEAGDGAIVCKGEAAEHEGMRIGLRDRDRKSVV